ncbi:MFS transporter [Dactylosporangium sp. NPDC005572]|uniref:MFS transporter n=1 Tax=Dactylosporangium sp. NPDC005572 TaxID=3156889 RepID=UPI0033AAA86F
MSAPATAVDEGSGLVPGGPDRLVRLVLALAVGSFTLQQCFVTPVLSRLQVEYSTDQATVTWALIVYLLAASIATPLLGRAGDTWGKKRMFVVALGGMAAGAFGAALAPSIGWLLAARAVQGAAGAVLPLSFGILRDVSRPERLSSGVSLMTSTTAVGFGLGLILAGPVVDTLGVRWLFWLPAGFATVIALAVLWVVPESAPTRAAPPPLLPALALGGWLGVLLLGLSRGGAWGWTSPWVLGMFAASAALVLIWVRLERRARTPLIDLRMMRLRGVWTTNLIVMLSGFSMFALFGFLPQLLQTPQTAGYGLGATVTESGRFLIPWSVTSFAAGMLATRIIRATSVRIVICVATVLMATAMLLIAFLHSTHWVIYLAMSMHGAGSGSVLAATALVVVRVVPPWQVGVASGMNANIRLVGGAVGATVMGVIVTGHLTATGYPAERGYTVGFVVLAGVFLLAHIAAYAIPKAGFGAGGTVAAEAAAPKRQVMY